MARKFAELHTLSDGEQVLAKYLWDEDEGEPVVAIETAPTEYLTPSINLRFAGDTDEEKDDKVYGFIATFTPERAEHYGRQLIDMVADMAAALEMDE